MAQKNKTGGRIATQPDGEPQGRHMVGFKGSKVETPCKCGKCHPNAQKNAGRDIWIVPKGKKDVFI